MYFSSLYDSSYMSSYESVHSKVSKIWLFYSEPTRKEGSCLFSVYVDS